MMADLLIGVNQLVRAELARRLGVWFIWQQ